MRVGGNGEVALAYAPRVTTDRYPIVIAGAGPVGLTLALSLLQQGFAVLILEKRPHLARDPRATTIQPPVLEVLADLGLLAAVDARGRRVHALQYWSWGAERALLAEIPLDLLRGRTAYPWRLHCSQPDLCEVLLAAIEAQLPGTVQFESRVTGFVDRGHYVEVKAESEGRTRTLRASWLCAADGASSGIRRILDVTMRTLPGVDTFLTGEIPDPTPALRGTPIGDAAFLLTKLGPALFMRMPASARLLLLVDPDDGVVEQPCASWVARIVFGEGASVDLQARGVYTVEQRVATRWRVGRVLLLGDAAHSTLPVSGTAMNTGILDGASLAEALPDSDAVDRWEKERRADLERRVDANAHAAWRFLTADGWFAQASRRLTLQRLARDRAAALEHVARASLLDDRR